MKLLSSCLGLVLQGLRLGICVFILYHAGTEFTNGQACKSWPTVNGELTTAEIKQHKSKGETKFEAELKYEYLVNGHKYSADRVQFGGLAFRDPAKVIEGLKSAKELSVHYKPDQPDVACLETGFNLNFVALEVLGALLLLVLAINDQLKSRRSKESRQSMNRDRQGKKLSSLAGLKEQKESGLTQAGSSKKNAPAIFVIVFVGIIFGISSLVDHIEIPGIPAKAVGFCAIFFGGLFIVILMSSIAPLVAILARKRHLALAETLANINAAIYSGFTSSYELALARGLQAEVAQERLQYDKALSFSKMALDAMASRNAALREAAEQKLGVLERPAMESSQKQFSALESVCNESLGCIYFDMGKYDDAMRHAKEAVKMADDLLKEPANDNPGTKVALACALALKGKIENAQGSFDDAKSDLKRAMTIRKECTLPYPDRLAIVMSHLASTNTMREEYRAAERLLDEGLQLVDGSSESAMLLAKATVQFHRAELKMHLGQYQSSTESINQCIALREELLVPNHPHIAEAYLLSSKISQLAGRSADAARLKEKASAMFSTCFGYKHPLIANSGTARTTHFSASK